jgi:hypothetical protein
MKTPPALATALLLRLGPHDESFVGDLVEEYGSGRSRFWYWRQIVTAILLTSLRRVGAHPVQAAAAVAVGWTTLLLLFFALGDRTAEALAGWLWDWDRKTAYSTQVWWPFQITAAFVSYAGFAISAWVVVRVSARHTGPILVAYAVSLVLALAASAAVLEILIQRNGRVAVPHTLFYLISVTLPYHWRSGVILGPSIALCVGLLACPPFTRQRSSDPLLTP